MKTIFCTKDNIEEATSWTLPSDVIDKIRNTGKSNQVFLIFQHISWIPKEMQEIHGNRGFIVTGGWNHSFHACEHNSCIVSFEVGKRAGRIGRTRNSFNRAVSIAQIEKWRDKVTEKLFCRSLVRPGD